MTNYPNSACEKHRDAKTSEPICVVCMMEENKRFRDALEDIAQSDLSTAGFRRIALEALKGK